VRRAKPADGDWIDPAEAGCRLIVRATAGDTLAPLLSEPAVAAVLLEVSDEARLREQVAEAHGAGRAAFLVDRADLVRRLGADGVHLNRPGELARARAALDRGELVGVACGPTRHDAMVAGEAGADYVLFGTPEAPPPDGIEALAEHVAWWAEIAVLPCVAAGRFSADAVRILADAGADFILPAIDGDAPSLAALASMLDALER